MKILGLDIYKGKYEDFLEIAKHPTKPTLVFTPNPEILTKAYRDDEFYHVLKNADYLVPDATGLYTASLIEEGKSYLSSLFLSLFQRKKIEETYGELIPGSTLTKSLVEYAIENGETILMIDNYLISDPQNSFEVKKMEVQHRLPILFLEKFPTLKVEILFDGDKSSDEIARDIEQKDIRFVFSCIGMKIQENRLAEIFHHLPGSTKVVGIGVGSSFDYLLGLQKRAPHLFQKYGLEWLYRLLMNPLGRWKRIKTAIYDFPKLVASNKNYAKP